MVAVMQWTHKDFIIKVKQSGRFTVIDGHESRDYDTLTQAKEAIDDRVAVAARGGSVMPYTPGPWQARQWSSGNWHIAPVAAYHVPLIASTEYQAGHGIDAPTEEANARLIAAAPDLLATLAAIVLPYREWLSDHADDAPTTWHIAPTPEDLIYQLEPRDGIEMTTSALREGLAAYDKAIGAAGDRWTASTDRRQRWPT